MFSNFSETQRLKWHVGDLLVLHEMKEIKNRSDRLEPDADWDHIQTGSDDVRYSWNGRIADDMPKDDI